MPFSPEQVPATSLASQVQSSSESDERLKKLEGWAGLISNPKGIIALVAFIGMLYTAYQTQFKQQQVDPNIAAVIKAAQDKTGVGTPADQKTVQDLVDEVKRLRDQLKAAEQKKTDFDDVAEQAQPPKTFQQQLSELTGEVSGLNSIVARQKSDIDDLQKKLVDTNAKIDAVAKASGQSLQVVPADLWSGATTWSAQATPAASACDASGSCSSSRPAFLGRFRR